VTLLPPDIAGTTDVATGASAVLLAETNPPTGVDDAVDNGQRNARRDHLVDSLVDDLGVEVEVL